MINIRTSLLLAALWSASTPAAPLQVPLPNARLELPEFTALAHKASQSVDITLDPTLLALAGRFLDSDDPQDAATLEVIKGLTGIYVKSYTFDQDNVYRQSDIDVVTKQLSAPGWTRLVQTKSRKTHANVDIYIMVSGGKALGLALIASEPREFTIVNILGSIDLDKLRKLEGHFGVPSLDVDVPAK